MTDLIDRADAWFRNRGRLRLLAPMAAFVIAVPALGQQRQPTMPQPGLAGPPAVINPAEDDSKMAQQMRRERNIMRQKKLESQMRLLEQLTSQLSTDINGAGLSDVDVAKRTEQIEKVAKSIRELMIGPLS
jgi:hypothetical protein